FFLPKLLPLFGFGVFFFLLTFFSFWLGLSPFSDARFAAFFSNFCLSVKFLIFCSLLLNCNNSSLGNSFRSTYFKKDLLTAKIFFRLMQPLRFNSVSLVSATEKI